MQTLIIVTIADITMFTIVHAANFCCDYSSKKYMDKQQRHDLF